MTNWQKIVDCVAVPKNTNLNDWLALNGPLELRIEAFLAKYEITELGSFQVAFTLPAGISRIEFLKEAQELSIALYASNREKYWANQVIKPDLLKYWESESRFSEAAGKDLSRSIDGRVKDSNNLTFKDQEDKGGTT